VDKNEPQHEHGARTREKVREGGDDCNLHGFPATGRRFGGQFDRMAARFAEEQRRQQRWKHENCSSGVGSRPSPTIGNDQGERACTCRP